MTEKFDLLIIGVIAVLVAAIGVVIVRGDQVGLAIRSYSPTASASSRTTITVTFDEPVDVRTAAQYFTIAPSTDGAFSASDTQLIWRPSAPLQPDTVYTVILKPGLTAISGRATKEAMHWQFEVREPRIVYLGPIDQPVQNLFAVDPSNPNAPQQITHSDNGIVGYDVTPDGSQIVYSEIAYSQDRSYGVTNLYDLDVASGKSKLLYACDAACTNLAWRPDGGAVAFQRVELNESVATGPNAPRVWLFDLASNSAGPLFGDSQMLGYSPRWSPDGTRLAVYSASSGGIIVHDFTSNQNTTIPTAAGEIGTFSPDGHWLYYPKIVVQGDNSAAVHYVLVNLTTTPYTLHELSPDSDPSSEVQAIWRADSQGLIVARQSTMSDSGDSLYDVDLGTGKAKSLVADEEDNQDNLALSPTGDTVLFQRMTQNGSVASPQVWLYNFSTGALKMLADKATLPGWLP